MEVKPEYEFDDASWLKMGQYNRYEIDPFEVQYVVAVAEQYELYRALACVYVVVPS